jgi:hypothetical protein
MITSTKSFTPQQKFRVNYAIENQKKLDLFGRGFKEIQNKEDALTDYMFSVCIENDTFDDYFTEKILDCFATGTIPIYKGTKNIKKYFNVDGILFLEDVELSDLNYEFYLSKMNSVKENFEIVKDYLSPEDFISKNYLNF